VIEAWAAISFEENSGRDFIPFKFLEDRLVGIVELFADTLLIKVENLLPLTQPVHLGGHKIS
jgi:hypothetical protein